MTPSTRRQESGATAVQILWVVLLALGFLAAWVATLVPVINGDSSGRNDHWFAGLTAVLALGVATLVLQVLGLKLQGLVLGRDNRLSTSKLQALMWTYALIGVLLAVIIDHWVGNGGGYQHLLDEGLRQEYLVLLGGPFAAAVAAKAIVSTKVENGTLTKTEGSEGAGARTRLAEAFSNDSGGTDLVDTQYLLFNLLALTYFIGTFVADPSSGVPEIPDLLVGLTGLSAATYVSNKAVQQAKPVLTSVVPAKAKHKAEVQLFGKNLLIPKAGSTLARPDFEEVIVLIGGVRVEEIVKTPADKGPVHNSTGDDRFRLLVPEGSPAGASDVVAINFKGVRSDPLTFEVLAD